MSPLSSFGIETPGQTLFQPRPPADGCRAHTCSDSSRKGVDLATSLLSELDLSLCFCDLVRHVEHCLHCLMASYQHPVYSQEARGLCTEARHMENNVSLENFQGDKQRTKI